MTHQDRDPFSELDQRARAASDGLRTHVLQHVRPEDSRADAPLPRARRAPLTAVAVLLALVVGAVALVGQGGDGRTRLDLDGPLPEPGVLRPLGPRDGKDSIRLPVTVEPSTGLRDGDVVSVRGEGFVPGEQVGIVQCAREAGGDTPEVRGGVDACNVADVVYADADDDGIASGTFPVHRVLTTPMTGTVDCAAEAERCIIGVGAISDYDRSGGHALTFADGGDPIEIPVIDVSPVEGLADRDVVRVSGSGLTPGTVLDVAVCSADPMSCWQTGEQLDGQIPTGLAVDDDGEIAGEVPVWRFLPGDAPGTYVDCAVSRCSLRFYGDTAPPTVPLAFTSDGPPPTAPSMSVEPTDGLAPGDTVVVRGAGFEPGSAFYVSLCAGPPGAADGLRYMCGSSDSGERRTDDDGSFAIEFEIPELSAPDDEGMATTTIGCAPGTECEPGAGWPSGDARCDDVHTSCSITVDLMAQMEGGGPPTWTPAPVPVSFR